MDSISRGRFLKSGAALASAMPLAGQEKEKRMPSIRVNGKSYEAAIDPQTPLLWYLRDHLGLMGTKYSCGIAECGACTVLVDGRAVLSCVTPLEDVFETDVVTIEGLAGLVADALFEAWITEDVPQCGYCQPGQIMTAAAFLSRIPKPTDTQIDDAMSGVLCRCGTYPAVRKAIHRAAGRLRP
jgi:aerobic-type carbon monoxide dehydrogenase small subunit (CoxS/CutS family)